MHPIDNATYSMQRSVATTIRSGRKRKAPFSGMEAAQSTIAAQKQQHGAGIHENPFRQRILNGHNRPSQPWPASERIWSA